ncbi:hypothetical protein PM082_009641 [Marasmius tenuissimus]|nr:hypothetical protein PM082_009641 [Marasmius tenuissimus]
MKGMAACAPLARPAYSGTASSHSLFLSHSEMASVLEKLKPPHQPEFHQEQQKWLEDFVGNMQGHYQHLLNDASEHN